MIVSRPNNELLNSSKRESRSERATGRNARKGMPPAPPHRPGGQLVRPTTPALATPTTDTVAVRETDTVPAFRTDIFLPRVGWRVDRKGVDP